MHRPRLSASRAVLLALAAMGLSVPRVPGLVPTGDLPAPIGAERYPRRPRHSGPPDPDDSSGPTRAMLRRQRQIAAGRLCVGIGNATVPTRRREV